MFGYNKVARPRLPGAGYLVKKFWFTIQGEGPLAGSPAIFVRFSGCNLRCFFCDTDFSGGTDYLLHALAHDLMTEAAAQNCGLFVFTGGEPMLQDIFALTAALQSLFEQQPLRGLPMLRVQIETAGTVWPASDLPGYLLEELLAQTITIVCSPKTPKVHPMIATYCRDWKYIIKHGDGDPLNTRMPATQDRRATPRALFRPPTRWERDKRDTIWMQPCDDEHADRNMHAAVKLAMLHNYRLSLQLHKIIGVE